MTTIVERTALTAHQLALLLLQQPDVPVLMWPINEFACGIELHKINGSISHIQISTSDESTKTVISDDSQDLQ